MLSRAGPVTFTLKLQLNVCCRASVIEQATVVVPTGNAEPDAGEQLTDNGWAPPETFGSSNVTRTGWRFAEWVTTGAGHAAVAGVGAFASLGSVGDDPCVQPAANSATATKKGTRFLIGELISITAVELCILLTRAGVRAKRGQKGSTLPRGSAIRKKIGRKWLNFGRSADV